ncbi:hypothetical protein BDV98DRAFT_635725 [Pterulicium gracile]|uniref:Uncharacterized protein n=1 Tax=Pterulicium gracile TaxID=1884261 RepID=A0A5C3Q8C1_9AGAR|nr:hypothetical protein BDV98DRAFT_635725 [Pterula gracilis]
MELLHTSTRHSTISGSARSKGLCVPITLVCGQIQPHWSILSEEVDGGCLPHLSECYRGGARSPVATTLGNPEENIYHPYRSKLDWDLANWANRHNPGSNALLELLAIPGVVEKLDVSYLSSREMSKIVNESLPDPATFLREEGRRDQRTLCLPATQPQHPILSEGYHFVAAANWSGALPNLPLPWESLSTCLFQGESHHHD